MNIDRLIADVYLAFNRRDVDGALAVMSENVSWPKASEGGRVVGKQDIRAYWGRQWQEFDPHVTPLAVSIDEQGKAYVRVHQVVRDLAGNLLADSEVLHIYTVGRELIQRMDLGDDEVGSLEAPTAAFAHR